MSAAFFEKKIAKVLQKLKRKTAATAN